MRWSKLSHTGLVRKKNEDNCCVCEDIGLLAVADGMGGHRAGETASRLALEAITDFMRTNPGLAADNPAEAMNLAFRSANDRIYQFAREQGEEYQGMGTTLAAVLAGEDKIYVAHIGDSRVYLVRGDEIRLLTSDHSLVNELFKSGNISADEAERHPQRNVLTRAVGTSEQVEADVREEAVQKGDMIILCTDGLSNQVNLEEIKEMAGAGEASLADRAEHFVARALERGGDDNITVILFQVE